MCDKNTRSDPVDCTLSLAMQPMFVMLSCNAILDGEEAPEYSRMLRLPKITKKSLNSARAVTSSYPVGQTVVKSKEPDEPPCQSSASSKSDQ